MAVADDPLLARLGLQIGMLCEKLSNLRFDRLGQQRTRAMAQDLGQAIGKGPWLARLITLLSDTAYHSFIGEVEALNTTTIRRLTPSGRHQLLAIAPSNTPCACLPSLPLRSSANRYGTINSVVRVANSRPPTTVRASAAFCSSPGLQSPSGSCPQSLGPGRQHSADIVCAGLRDRETEIHTRQEVNFLHRDAVDGSASMSLMPLTLVLIAYWL
jgi:hypothetical protein